MGKTERISKEESNKFKSKLAIKGMTIIQFCRDNDIEYNSFNGGLNGYRGMPNNTLNVVREFIKNG